MVKMNLKLLATIILLILLQGCVLREFGLWDPPPISDKDDAIEACRDLCRQAKADGLELEHGPCLSTENEDWDIEGWVCDVSHFTRTQEDDLKENQCPEFKESAWNFVEVTPNCTLIRIYG